MRHKKLVMLVLGMIGQSYIGHIRSDGSIRESPTLPGQLTSTLSSKYPGVSTDDLKQNLYPVIVNDFAYDEITKLIVKLTNVKVASFTFTDKIRYVFDPKYEKLIPFVNTCIHILGILLVNMKHKWFLKKKPAAEEIHWFTLIVGKEQMRLFFTTLEEERKFVIERLRRDYEHDFGKCDYVEAILKTPIIDKKFIKDNDLTIKRQTEELEKNYHDIKTTFPVFYELMKEMIYPSFLH